MNIYKGTAVYLDRFNTFKISVQKFLSNILGNVLRCKTTGHSFPICYFKDFGWVCLAWIASNLLASLFLTTTLFFKLSRIQKSKISHLINNLWKLFNKFHSTIFSLVFYQAQWSVHLKVAGTAKVIYRLKFKVFKEIKAFKLFNEEWGLYIQKVV